MKTPATRAPSRLTKCLPGPPSKIGEGLTVEKGVKALEEYARECALQNKEYGDIPKRES